MRHDDSVGTERQDLSHARPRDLLPVPLDGGDPDQEALPADGARAPQPLDDGGDRRDVVAAFQVQEEEVIERIAGQPLAAFAGLYGRRPLPAPPLLIGGGTLVGYEDAEGRGAVGPQVYEDVLVLEGTWILTELVSGIITPIVTRIRRPAGGETHEHYTSMEPSPGGEGFPDIAEHV